MIVLPEIDNYLAQELGGLETTLKILSSVNKTDSAVELEDFLIPIFNIYFSTEFKNINKYAPNFTGIDLYSQVNKIAIQITVDTSANKKRDCLLKVKKLVEDSEIEIRQLYIFVLTSSNSRVLLEETEYFEKKNVLNIPSILKLNTEKKKLIVEHIQLSLKRYFSPVLLRYKKYVDAFFVETNVYKNALRMIDDKHVLIINGNAGTGKTITSYKVLFDYLEKGYTYLDNIQSLSEHRDSGNKYILLVDDAITSTDVVDADHKKIQENFSVVDIANDNLKIILNSRTNIISNYSTLNSRFYLGKYKKYFVSSEKLTELEKFNIFVRHIENSYDKESLLTLFESGLLSNILSIQPIYKIINHHKYNPRIIEHFNKRIPGDFRNDEFSSDSNLAKNIIDALDNPDFIYNEQYNKLGNLDKEIMKYIAIMSGEATLDQINEHFKNALRIEIKNSLFNLDECFLLQSEFGEKIVYKFFNPSIKDFCNNILRASVDLSDNFTPDKDSSVLISLLKFPNISNETKVNTIKNHPKKKEILKNNDSSVEDLLTLFESDLEEIFVEDAYIPYNYRNVMSSDKILCIEEKFDSTKAVYISSSHYLPLSDYFTRFITENSSKLVCVDVQSKIISDYESSLESYIYENIDLISYDEDFYDDSHEISIHSSSIQDVADSFQSKIASSIFFSITHDDLYISDIDEETVSFEGLLDILSEIKNDVINIYALIKYLLESTLCIEISSSDLSDYILDNIYVRDECCEKDELDIQIHGFRDRIYNM